MNKELCKYLSEEYMKCVKAEEALMQEKYSLQAEQRKAEENLYFHAEEERTRQLFSPLSLRGYDYSKELTQENFQLSDAGIKLGDCKKKLQKIEEKKEKLKGFIHSLKGEPVFAKEKAVEPERILFFPAFYELVHHTEKAFPDAEFLYDEEETVAGCYMTFAFLNDWKILFRYILEKMEVADILFRWEEDREESILIMEVAAEQALDASFKEELQQRLSKRFSIQDWKEDAFEIHMIIEKEK